MFSAMLVALGALPEIGMVMGSRAPLAGVVANLVIAVFVGVTYAVFFRRSSFDIMSGIGWGVCYGFFWWVPGTLTLLPAVVGVSPRWDAVTIALAFPSLVVHLAYGAALGASYTCWSHARTPGGSPATRPKPTGCSPSASSSPDRRRRCGD